MDWEVADASTVTIAPEVGSVPLRGSRKVKPGQTTDYALTAQNGQETRTARVSLSVIERQPRIRFTGTPASIPEGGEATLSWNVQGATSVQITPGVGTVSLSGTRRVSPASTTTYVLTAGNEGRPVASSTVTVEVRALSLEENHSVGPLPGDQIVSFRVIQKTADSMQVELSHGFNSNHGRVWIGNCLLDASGTELNQGFFPTPASTSGKTIVKISVNSAKRNVRSKEVFFWLYEEYKGQGFVCRRFPYESHWN